jgi:hypothetical protein
MAAVGQPLDAQTVLLPQQFREVHRRMMPMGWLRGVGPGRC